MSGYLSLKMPNTEQVSPNLYIVGLPLDFNENDLYELCSKTANVVECKCLAPKEGKTTKAGFVNFESIEDSQKAFSFFSVKENNPLQLVIRYSRRYVQSKVSAQLTQSFSSDKPSFSRTKSVNSRSSMEEPTRSAESPLFNDREDNFQTSLTPSYSEDTCRGSKEYPNFHHQQPIISFPETPRAMSVMSQFELLRNIQNFQSGKEKSVEYRGKDIVISLRNDINVRPPDETKIICVICCTSADFCCARCKSVNYCGVNCQIFDWVENDHRTDCLKDERPTPFQCFSRTSSISSFDASNNYNYMPSVEGASALAQSSSTRLRRIRHKYIPITPLRKPRVFDSVASQKSPGEPTLSTVYLENTEINMATLPRQCLREGDKVVACFGSNPYKFYVQKFSDLDDLSFIMNKLNGESLESIPTVQVNSFCAAKYIDGKWYRAKIEKVSDDRQNVEAFFFDFGNTDVVQISNLCKMHIDLLNFSAKAYGVRLLKVKPLNHAKDFSSETLQKISELLTVTYTVKKSIYTIEGIFTVELEDDNGNNLSNLLLEEKIVDPVSVYLMKTEKSSAKADVDKKPLINLQEQFLNCGDEVFLCYGNNPRNFYVQKSLDLEELIIIHNQLLKESNEASSFGNCTVGSICAAKYKNGIWYRAKIILKQPNGMYKVYFIDFGNVEVLSSSDLICISSKLSYSPKAFRCCLYKANCDVFTEPVENELQAFGAMVKEVRKKSQTYEIELISQISKEDISALLTKSLVIEHDQLKRGNENKQDPLNMNPGLGASSNVIENHFPIVEVEPVTENAPQKNALESTDNLTELPNQCLVPGDKVLFCNGRNPRRFYVHKMSEVEEFLLLTETLQTSSSQNVSIHPEVGLICSTLSEDGLWYRSRIMKILGDGNVEVFFVDFGNTFIVNPSSLQPLPKLLSKYSAKVFTVDGRDPQCHDKFTIFECHISKWF